MKGIEENKQVKIGITGSGGETSVYDFIAATIAEQFISRENHEVYWIYEGFRGLIRGFDGGGIKKATYGDITKMKNSRAGKIIKGCRSYNSFNYNDKDYSIETMNNLAYFDIVFVIGGDGSMGQCADYISTFKEGKIPHFIGLVATMDGAAATGTTLGESTAAFTILREIESSHDSAISLVRFSVVEAMGRYCGEPVADAALLYLKDGKNVAAVITPQVNYNLECIAESVLRTNGGVVVVSEGIDREQDKPKKKKSKGYHQVLSGAADYIATKLKAILDVPENRLDEWQKMDVKGTVTGYGQRAASATKSDMDHSVLHVMEAVKRWDNGESNFVIVTDVDGKIGSMPIPDFVAENRIAEQTLLMKYHPRMQRVLETLRDNYGVYVGEFK